MRRLNDERGAAAVVTAILLVMLIGFTALAVDVGALWWDKKELQNGADAAALALAQGCAQGDACPDDAMADGYATENKSDSNVTVEGVTLPTSDSVRVTVSSEREFWFAPVLGIDSGDVSASATASWGPVGGARVLPLTVSACYLTGAHAGGDVWIPIKDHDEATECAEETHYIPGGFGWLVPEAVDCRTTTHAGTYAYSNTGNSGPTGVASCTSRLKSLGGETVLIPVFDEANGTGAGGTFHLTGYAHLRISTYCFNKGQDWYHEGTAPEDKCTGSNRFARGTFIEMVSLDAEIGEGEDYGTTTVQLTE